jgi:hypothetical protein
MTDPKQNRLSPDEVLALRGLRLPAVALKRLQRAGIYCQPAISIEFQRGAQRYLIRGVESGGAVAQIGAYCGFLDDSGALLNMLQPVHAVGVNGLHVAVLSPTLVRGQMFRAGTSYELLLSHHVLISVEGKGRPVLRNSILFHGKHGGLEMELWGKSSQQLCGLVSPVFYSKSGDQLAIPDRFHDALLRLTAGACCIGCRHSHLAEGNGLDANVGISLLQQIEEEQPQ